MTETKSAPINRFFSEQAWVEGSALAQVDQLAALPDALAVTAMPDLHPGKYGPVGAGLLSTNIHPLIVGSDIGCGMSLFKLDLKRRKLRADKAVDRLRVLDHPWDEDTRHRVEAYNLSPTVHDCSLGSIGGGNHFCELQAIHEIFDQDAATSAGLEEDHVFCLIHTGSRGLGYSVLTDIIQSGSTDLDDAACARYMFAHDHAKEWARLNRSVVAERVALALRAGFMNIADISHNHIEMVTGGYLHRKGAAPADQGLVPIPGSRETLSYLVKPLVGAPMDALACLAHGAGRKYDRGSMHGRIERTKSKREAMSRNPFGGYIVCEDRNLMLEEAGDAYKNIDRVIADMVTFDLIQVVATFKPLVTFKTGLSTIGARNKGDWR